MESLPLSPIFESCKEIMKNISTGNKAHSCYHAIEFGQMLCLKWQIHKSYLTSNRKNHATKREKL